MEHPKKYSKRKWIKEYRCNKFSMNIIKKMTFCREKIECKECKFKG